MELERAESSRKLIEAFEKATKQFNLCPNRVWAVAKDKIPMLLPDATSLSHVTENTIHGQCTFDFCEYSQRDFTAVEQRHECKEKAKCVRIRGRFSRYTLNKAALAGKLTTWQLDGKALLNLPLPYMAVSHVWSDGTGTGGQEGEVNKCLYGFFHDIAVRFQCKGIWWDTICIPKDHLARAQAIKEMHNNYQDARLTLVHDCFLRDWEWSGAEAACFAILMSPWFSRGWTALELAKSPKVKIVFKGPCGPIIKDLDEEILAGEDDNTSAGHRVATDIIRNLRKGITTLDGLLTVLGSRYTSWPKDRAIISGLLVDPEVVPKVPGRDIWQQDIYKNVLRKFGKISPGHLFHSSATLSSVSWCPTSLFNMPTSQSDASLRVTEELDVVGKWRVVSPQSIPEERYIWNNTHPLLKARLKLHLQSPEACALLVECDKSPVDRALLVKAVDQKATSASYYRYIGAVYFHSGLTEDGAIQNGDDWSPREVILCAKGLDGVRGKTLELSGGSENESTVQQSKSTKQYGSDSLPVIVSGDRQRHENSPPPQSVDMNRPDSFWSPLHYAIWRGTDSLFAELVETADPYVFDTLQQLPIHLAAERGSRDMLSSLLAKVQRDGRAEEVLHAQCSIGQCALHRASWGGSVASVEMLLNAGSNANAEDAHGNTALHIAAEKGYEAIVTVLLKYGVIDAKDEKGLTALHYAVMGGHTQIARQLIQKFGNIEARDSHMGWTPLHYAADCGHQAVVDLLLRNSAEVNAKDEKVLWTPLHFATMKGHSTIAQLLLDSGADATAKDKYGWTPLRFASEGNHLKLVQVLAEVGAHVDSNEEISWTLLHCAASDGQPIKLLSTKDAVVGVQGDTPVPNLTPLLYAATNGYESVVQRLLEMHTIAGGSRDMYPEAMHLAATNGHERIVQLFLPLIRDVNSWCSASGLMPLSAAAKEGHLAIVQLLLDHGADVNKTRPWKSRNEEKNGDTLALYLAAKNGHEGVVELLLRRGANVNVRDISRFTPLHIATFYGNEAIIQLLLDHGADVNAKHLGEWTALASAVQLGNEGAVRLLLNRGAAIKDSTPDTPLLHLALIRGYTGIVHLLLNHGADIEQEDEDGCTPAFLAALLDKGDILVLLAQRDNHEGRTLLHEAAGCGDEDMLHSFLKHGAPVNIRDSLQRTPLHLAASNEKIKALKLLLDNGADVNAKDSEGRTPLYHAALRGHKAVVQLLVSSGGDINIKDETGWSLLHRAAVYNDEELGLLLLENGADGNVIGLQNWTPLHWAASNGHTRIVKALIDHGANVNVEDSDGRLPLHLAASNEHKDIVQILIYGDTEIVPEVS